MTTAPARSLVLIAGDTGCRPGATGLRCSFLVTPTGCLPAQTAPAAAWTSSTNRPVPCCRTRLWPSLEGNLAHAQHVIGSLLLTAVSMAAAEVALQHAGAALMALSIRRGPIHERYGAWDRVIA